MYTVKNRVPSIKQLHIIFNCYCRNNFLIIITLKMAIPKDHVKKDTLKHTGLKKCFTALVDRKQINLDIEVLRLMLKKELQINLDSLDEHLASIMPLMLVVYMKTWPGWQRSKEYFSGKLNFKEWYEKFRQYIVLRLNFLIKNGYNNVMEEIRNDKKKEAARLNPNNSIAEHGTQTDFLAPKAFAPFTISIECPPSILNSVVFIDSADDIIIRQHPDIPWSNIDIKQLSHWPNIEIEFHSPELSFRRKTCCEFNRYINFVNTPLTYDKTEYIEQVEIINPFNGRQCYTLNMLRHYADQYLTILHDVEDMDREYISNLEIILYEFLKDIEEIDMNKTMATNTSVLFNIGKCTFLRNKKMAKGPIFRLGSNTDVGYCEIITPKMETSLNFFKGVQDPTTNFISFSYLNSLIAKLATRNTKSTIETDIPVLKYKCNFCNVSFNSNVGILKHLEQLHKMDPCVLCIKCKRSYPINSLTSVRWQHLCNNP